MARTVTVQLLDDIDGSRADETLAYGLDGVNYEIDLNAQHAENLRAALAAFILKSRRVGRGRITASRGRVVGTPPGSDRVHNQAIRDWAKSHGIDISERGRIPRSVLDRYEAASR
jgi:nucleoid-associated protein Lsr2